MIHTAILREVWTRLLFHSNASRTNAEGDKCLLGGLKVKKAGEFRIDGKDDLPLITLVDLSGQFVPGKPVPSGITLFLKTKKSADWFRTENELGLADWMEAIMDAVETRPSDSQTDLYFCAHNLDGTPIRKGGKEVQLLSEPITWDFRMAEISDLAFTMQMDIHFTAPNGGRGNRRTSPLASGDYAA